MFVAKPIQRDLVSLDMSLDWLLEAFATCLVLGSVNGPVASDRVARLSVGVQGDRAGYAVARTVLPSLRQVDAQKTLC
jgi:hypothetical protein